MNFFRPNAVTRNIAEALMNSATNNDVYAAIINTTSQVSRTLALVHCVVFIFTTGTIFTLNMSVLDLYVLVEHISHNYFEALDLAFQLDFLYPRLSSLLSIETIGPFFRHPYTTEHSQHTDTCRWIQFH